MKSCYIICLITFLAAAATTGCDGKDADPSVPGLIGLSTSKAVALADGKDAVIVSAYVWRAGYTSGPEGHISGEPVMDGTEVSFSVDSGILSASTATTTNGLASVTLTHTRLTDAANLTVHVSCSAGDVVAGRFVKFINQPASVDVFIGTSERNLSSLEFVLKSGAGATFDNDTHPISPVGFVEKPLVAGYFDINTRTTTISLRSVDGLNIFRSRIVSAGNLVSEVPPAPPPPIIIKATFAVAADAGLPAFSIDATAPIIATDSNGNSISPPVTDADLYVSVTYDTELGETNRPVEKKNTQRRTLIIP